MKTLRLILGDQLNQQHSWFSQKDDAILYVLMEIRQETDYVRHHIQKVVAIFAAMREFTSHLKREGHRIEYLRIGDLENKQSLLANLSNLISKFSIDKFEYQLPDEYRLDRQLRAFCEQIQIDCEACDTEHFLTSRTHLADFFRGKKGYTMEYFYRDMRKRFQILMDTHGQPLGGKWNYDQENRNKWKGAPKPAQLKKPFRHDRILQEIEGSGIKTIGRVPQNVIPWPINRKESLQFLEHFLKHSLPYFGKYQDAMHTDETILFHSCISFALNVKLISPLEVIQKAIDYRGKNQELISLAQIEGFVRQILGWREYLRGVYWAQMPNYAQFNFFENRRNLPNWYWSGDTKMSCLQKCITQSLDLSYAHHIQRLMVTGNFALLAGCDPDQVDAWYLGIYIDAIQWVEITNTRGMSQYADGGIVGTKPYISSAAYIHKMSNYCDGCYYNRKDRYGSRACPYNALYWNFLIQHYDRLKGIRRMSMMLRMVDKMDNEEKEKIITKSDIILNSINSL